MDDYFTRAEILRRHRAGFFGAYLNTYTSAAMEQGFQPETVRSHCYVFRLFGQRAERRGLSIDEFDVGSSASSGGSDDLQGLPRDGRWSCRPVPMISALCDSV